MPWYEVVGWVLAGWVAVDLAIVLVLIALAPGRRREREELMQELYVLTRLEAARRGDEWAEGLEETEW